jgi:hypothetical protein
LITARNGSTSAFTYSTAEGFLRQIPFRDLLGIPLEPDMVVTFQVISGSAFVYGVTGDNRSNDSSFQLARRLPGSGK